MSLDVNQLTLNSEARDSSLVLPLASLTKLEVSRGQKSRADKGARIGLGTGVAAGVVTALAVCADNSCDGYTGLAVLIFGAGGALGGVLIGAVIGSFIQTDRWETVPLDRISVSLRPRGGGLEVSAKFVF